MKSKLNWKARRNGRFYCAPACGGRCTWEAYQQARKDGAALAKELGTGWKFSVWENLGWFYKATNASLTVSIYPPLSTQEIYWADLCGVGGNQWTARGRTPALAVAHVVKAARKELVGLKKLVALLEDL